MIVVFLFALHVMLHMHNCAYKTLLRVVDVSSTIAFSAAYAESG